LKLETLTIHVGLQNQNQNEIVGDERSMMKKNSLG
jgi:hypothetical protein